LSAPAAATTQPIDGPLAYLSEAVAAAAVVQTADRLGVLARLDGGRGAGAAPWSLALAARDPACLVTAVDLPAVLPATRRAVTDAGCERQFRFLAGDLFDVELGRGAHDLAIAGNLCHLFDEAANRRLLGRLHDALRPGGTLAVVDVMPGDGPTPRWVALYELGLLLRTASGRVHPLAAYLGWLHDAGFEPPERHRLVDRAQGVLLVARNPPGG